MNITGIEAKEYKMSEKKLSNIVTTQHVYLNSYFSSIRHDGRMAVMEQNAKKKKFSSLTFFVRWFIVIWCVKYSILIFLYGASISEQIQSNQK